MKSAAFPLGFVMFIGVLAGCDTASTRAPRTPERTSVAPGVELVLSEDAGPEARRIAEEIHERYASELITARPAEARSWLER